MNLFPLLAALTGLLTITHSAPTTPEPTTPNCETGSTWCDNTRVMTCLPNNHISVLEQCGTGEACVSPGKSAPHCARVCEAEGLFCNDNQLIYCTSDLNYFMIDNCATNGETCVMPGKSAPHCSRDDNDVVTRREEAGTVPVPENITAIVEKMHNAANSKDTNEVTTADASAKVYCGSCNNQFAKPQGIYATGYCNNITPVPGTDRYVTCHNTYCGICILFA